MKFNHQQLSLWYGTDDAPAPLNDVIVNRQDVALTVAAQPHSASNSMTIRYRVDDGAERDVRAVLARTDFAAGVDYYTARFPTFWTGKRVSYVPVLRCSGRCVPDIVTADRLPSSFQLENAPVAQRLTNEMAPFDSDAGWIPPTNRLPYSLEYLASVRIPLKEPEIVGVTPEGITVNWYWYPAQGIVAGPKLNARVRELGGDWMTIRRDGVGVMDVRATLETPEGALLYVSYLGHYELGENGYQDFLARRWPAQAPTRTTPRVRTAHQKYQWLNRLQCLGIGEVRMQELTYTYDLYAVR